MSQPRNLGELKRAGAGSVPVREEMRRNLVRKLAAGSGCSRACWATTSPCCRAW
jgi:hypothetical protein